MFKLIGFFFIFGVICCKAFHLDEYLSRNKRDVKISDVKLLLNEKDILNDEKDYKIDGSKPTVFITHGYTHNSRQKYYKNLKDAFLKNNPNYDVIYVDWEKPAKSLYKFSAKNTRFVGYILAEFIVNKKIELKNVHLVGHSLGAHVSGFAGKKVQELVGKKVRRITGLDPAGPYFNEAGMADKDKLSKEDAEIVVAIHTDYGLFGYKNPDGTIDIYANGGRVQPHCVDESKTGIEATICPHMIATDYFAEFINKKTKCQLCNSFEDISKNSCSSGTKLEVSSDDITEKTTGICYLKTNHKSPFLI